MFFASDNGAPVPAPVMAALLRANEGMAMPYGNDPLTEAVRARIREVFEAPQAAVYMLATGTAANAIAAGLLCPPWGTLVCHADAHVQHDECGAPEFYTAGAKLVPLPGEHGRLSPGTLDAALAEIGRGRVHGVQKAALSLTNVTEAGTVYTPEAIAALAAVAHRHGVGVHLDGARLANALAATGASPAAMTWRAGVDVLSLGGTKGGLMAAEAVVIFDPARAWEFELRRKRGGHLFSKYRYLAAQFDGWLEGGLWLGLAQHANAMAARLAAGVAGIAGARLLHPAEANIVMAALPHAALARAREAGAIFYDRAGGTPDAPAVRLVCSWATTAQEVDALLEAFGR
jgi:threonine aldolase